MSSAPLVLFLEDSFTARPLEEDPLQERPLVQLRVNNHRVFAGKPFPHGHPLMRAYYGEISVPMPAKLAKVQLHIAIAERDLDQSFGFDLARGQLPDARGDPLFDLLRDGRAVECLCFHPASGYVMKNVVNPRRCDILAHPFLRGGLPASIQIC